jgi:hypothetical protein
MDSNILLQPEPVSFDEEPLVLFSSHYSCMVIYSLQQHGLAPHVSGVLLAIASCGR